MGYRNPLHIIDLSDLGDGCYVTIRNPKLLPLEKLTPVQVPMGPDGRPIDDAEAQRAVNEMLAGIIHDWRMYDANDMSDDPAPLPLPATAETVAKLPGTALKQLMDAVTSAVAPAAGPGNPTGRTSS